MSQFQDALLSLDRRSFLSSAGGLVAWSFMPRVASAGRSRDPRLLIVVLRGGLDGLSVVAPVGDPNYERARGGLVLERDGASAAMVLDNFFVLNSSMPTLAKLYRSKQAIVVHATATPYRSRSHFDGQDVLESGMDRPTFTSTGWLNRALTSLAPGDPVAKAGGLCIGHEVPLVMRGPAPVVSWMPPGFPEVTSTLPSRLLDLYKHTDPGMANLLEEGLKLKMVVGTEKEMASRMAGMTDAHPQVRAFREAAVAAGKLMAAPAGPRVASLSYVGWDTHTNQRQLGRLLQALDGAIEGLSNELSSVWENTVVAIITEFGRTVHMNGTSGTDHGTATTAILIGGALKGGRIITDWPGLSDANLHEGRDLKPTTDLRAPLKGLLADHLGLSRRVLDETIFPGSASVAPMTDLLAA